VSSISIASRCPYPIPTAHSLPAKRARLGAVRSQRWRLRRARRRAGTRRHQLDPRRRPLGNSKPARKTGGMPATPARVRRAYGTGAAAAMGFLYHIAADHRASNMIVMPGPA